MGLALNAQYFWLSDPANNRVLKTDHDGKIIEEYNDFLRPMHISEWNNNVYVPEFITDTIKVIGGDKIETLGLLNKPDAPSAVDVEGNLIAIADFYNHRIILQENEVVNILGKEGHKEGELFYPTDVEILGELIYVADAYNNRVQVFDKLGNTIRIIGDKDGINVATGIAIHMNQLFVTDFFGNRVLVYDLEGNLIQELVGHFNKPTEVSIFNDVMYVTNFEGQNINVFGVFKKSE